MLRQVPAWGHTASESTSFTLEAISSCAHRSNWLVLAVCGRSVAWQMPNFDSTLLPSKLGELEEVSTTSGDGLR